MKLCLACGTEFTSRDWRCPGCGKSPEEADGWMLFAPALAHSNTGMDPEAHHLLDALQEKSFWFRARNRLISDLVRRYFPRAATALEVGCGTGYVLRGLTNTKEWLRLCGSEIYVDGLPYARRRLGASVELFQMDARSLPFADEFDLICAFDVLEHIEEDEDVLSAMHKALTPEGGVLISVPQHPFLWSRADEVAYHKRRYSRGELEDKCRRAGFEILRSTSFVSTLLPPMLLQRLIRSKDADYDARSELQLSPVLDRCFEILLDSERHLIAAGLSLPVGGSRFVAAVKRKASALMETPAAERSAAG